MGEHDGGRRAFLKGAVGVGAAAGIAQSGFATEAHVNELEPYKTESPKAERLEVGVVETANGHGAFFNEEDAATIAAFTERLMPGAPGKPGARDAGVLNYIDLALAGAYSDQQDFYRRGLAHLDTRCRGNYRRPFVHLTPVEQDKVIGTLEQGKAGAFTYPTGQAFFNTARTHTMEGYEWPGARGHVQIVLPSNVRAAAVLRKSGCEQSAGAQRVRRIAAYTQLYFGEVQPPQIQG
jgi:gluconate 2-dehydrogenase subunit 3-like protein